MQDFRYWFCGKASLEFWTTRERSLISSQPFLRHVPLNPAHDIARSIPLFLPATKDRSTAVRISQHPHAVPVSYKAVRALVPAS